MNKKKPGLYVSRERYKSACLLAAQPKTINNAMNRWWNGPDTIFVDESLARDDWYIVDSANRGCSAAQAASDVDAGPQNPEPDLGKSYLKAN